jgi:hypothetical protein
LARATEAPASTRVLTTARWPFRAAQWRGVFSCALGWSRKDCFAWFVTAVVVVLVVVVVVVVVVDAGK